MKHTFLAAVAVLIAGRSLSAQYFEARNTAMGGTGTASSHYLAAGFANPALLARKGVRDTLGFLVPTVGVAVQDETDLLRDMKDFVDEYDRIQNGGGTTPQDYIGLAARLQALSGRQLTGSLGAGLAVAAPSESFGWSLHLHSYADLRAVAIIDPADLVAIAATPPGNALPNLNSEARILGAGITELGFSCAHRFDLGPAGLAIGATPKYQRVDTYNYAVDANNFDSGNFNDSQYRNDDGAFNLDLGASLDLPLGFTFGVMGRNLIAHTYDTALIAGEQFGYRIEPVVTVGAAWTFGMLTVSGDIDAMKTSRFTDQTPSLAALQLVDDVQYVRLGAELDLLSWLQLRGGIQGDIQNEIATAYTGGVGLSPFGVVHLDLAGIYAGDHSYGAVVQFALTF